MAGSEDHQEGKCVDSDGRAQVSAEGHLEVAEAKLERAHEERAQADRDEREAREEIREVEAELRHEHHAIHFKVDGEDYETKQRVWTPNNILREFPKLDPATHYLVQLTGKAPISYKGKGDIPIELHDCEAFQAISEGPTPVSDGRILTGVAAFVEGLRKLGFNPIQAPGHSDRVVIDYVVPAGTKAGRAVRLGFIIPPDFPATPPSGPHVSPAIHPVQAGGVHPTGGVHASPFGADWQYWSRPFQQWVRSARSAAAYMGHVFTLWATQ